MGNNSKCEIYLPSGRIIPIIPLLCAKKGGSSMKCIPSHYLPHWITLGHLHKGRVFCFEALQHGEHDPLVELEALGSLGDSAPQGSSCLLLFRCIAFQFLLFLPGPVHHQISLRRRQFAKLRMK